MTTPQSQYAAAGVDLSQAEIAKARIGELSTGQLIALRFATDGEVAELVREVLASDIQDKKVIKSKIRNWRADFLRV